MSNYIVDGADLASVADAIRTKGGTSASLAFPAGFVSAIAAIPSGGGDMDDYEDFTAGNIQAIVGHGTEYILTDYYGTLKDLISIKIKDTDITGYEGYWAIASGNATNAVQRYASGNTFSFNFQGHNANGISISGFSSGLPVILVHSTLGFDALTVNHPLVIGRNYYRGAFEAVATFTFYGLNILDGEGKYVKRFMPWLENGVACVKEILSGNLYYNSGTGNYDYIDKEGVLHNA